MGIVEICLQSEMPDIVYCNLCGWIGHSNIVTPFSIYYYYLTEVRQNDVMRKWCLCVFICQCSAVKKAKTDLYFT